MAKLKSAPAPQLPSNQLTLPEHLKFPELAEEQRVRVIFPLTAINANVPITDSIFRNITTVPQEHRGNLLEYAKHAFWFCFNWNYVYHPLGEGLLEVSRAVVSRTPRSIRTVLHNAEGGLKPVEVGYRSTRLDMAGNPIKEPRAYLGTVAEITPDSVLLRTAYGLRRLRLDGIAWAGVSPGTSVQLRAVDFILKPHGLQQILELRVLSPEETVADEPRGVFEGELDMEEAHKLKEFIGVNQAAVRLLVPYHHKEVYVEIFNKGEQIYSLTGKLSRAYWKSGANNPLSLCGEDGQDLVSCSTGHSLRIWALDELPENSDEL